MSCVLDVPLPGDDGMYGERWKVRDIGPTYFEGKGLTSFMMMKEKCREEDVGGGGGVRTL